MIKLVMWIFFLVCIGTIIYTVLKKDETTTVLVFIILVLGFIFGISADYEGYERGQIDALNGEFKYKMEVKQDTSYVKK